MPRWNSPDGTFSTEQLQDFNLEADRMRATFGAIDAAALASIMTVDITPIPTKVSENGPGTQ